MKHTQPDLFAQDDAECNTLSELRLLAIRSRLEATLAKLEAIATFHWKDALEAVHEENRFERDAEMLGDEGAVLWARFDKEMNRLYATQSAPNARVAASAN